MPPENSIKEAYLAKTAEDGVFVLVRQQWIHRFLFDDGGIIDVIAIKDDPMLRDTALAFYQRIPDVKSPVAIVGMALVGRVTDEDDQTAVVG